VKITYKTIGQNVTLSLTGNGQQGSFWVGRSGPRGAGMSYDIGC
jgi:hypothetical protein